MEHWYRHALFRAPLLVFVVFILLSACEGREEKMDQVTGNRAVKQYHKAKKDIEKITDQQAAKYDKIPDEETQEDDS